VTALRIALLTYSTKPRGSVVHTCELANAIAELGHEVCIYALDKDGSGFDFPLTCATALVRAAPAPPDTDALIRQRIGEFVAAIAADPTARDIYHAQDCLGANALLELRRIGRIPHFARTVHHIEAYASPYLRACQDQSIRAPDLCLCVSERWQRALQQQYAIAAPRVANGVNVQRFSARPSGREAAIARQYGCTGSPLFFTVGGIEPRKNSLRLLAAFAEVRKTQPHAQLAIAGGATLFDYRAYREEFFQLLHALDLPAASFRLLRPVPDADLPELYRCADAFCFPSLVEGWGLVVFEAIAAGCPVVLSRQAPFTEFLAPDQACWTDPTDPSSIARAMLSACGDRSETARRAAAILPDYSWQRSACKHLELYTNLLQKSA